MIKRTAEVTDVMRNRQNIFEVERSKVKVAGAKIESRLLRIRGNYVDWRTAKTSMTPSLAVRFV